MIETLTIKEEDRWISIVESFDNYDIYYLPSYLKPFMTHGDGEPKLFHYQQYGLEAIYAFMKRKTSISGLFDIITPYGYGGILFKGDTTESNIADFFKDWREFCRRSNIVDNFIRFHPVLGNAELCKSGIDVIDLGMTIAIDLESQDKILANMSPKNRNKIRKAEKNGVEIHHSQNPELFKIFKEIYDETMRHDNALDYYYFDESFYLSIAENMKGNYEIFYATYESKIISIAIMIFANNKMHYHLSGSVYEYRPLASTNLLLYKAALWGVANGMKTLHLGGGLGSEQDNLYKFKESFNTSGQYQFSIGKEIFNREQYSVLVELRKKSDSSFNPDSSFFPLYRS